MIFSGTAWLRMQGLSTAPADMQACFTCSQSIRSIHPVCRWKPKKLPGLPAASRVTVSAGGEVQLRRSHCCSTCNWSGCC